MASIWRHPNSKYWTAWYTNKNGRQVKRSTKHTQRKDAMAVAMEFERVEQQAPWGSISTVQIQKVFNELVERTTGDSIMTPSVEKDWPWTSRPSRWLFIVRSDMP